MNKSGLRTLKLSALLLLILGLSLVSVANAGPKTGHKWGRPDTTVLPNWTNFKNFTFKDTVDKNLLNDSCDYGIIIVQPDSSNSYLGSSMRFLRPTTFRNAQFKSVANFIGAQFDSSIDFRFANFDSTAQFRFATFKSEANFSGARDSVPEKYLYFQNNVPINARVDFRGVRFQSGADFRLREFRSNASFRIAEFLTTSDFRKSKFDSTADFSRMRLGSHADFRYVSFVGDVNFDDAVLPETLDFRYVKLAREVDFTSCMPPTDSTTCHLYLFGTDVNKVKLRMGLFTLEFPQDIITNESRNKDVTSSDEKAYTLIIPGLEQKESFYQQLLTKLKSDGMLKSYQDVDISFRDLKAQAGNNWDKFINFLDRHWWNYGYSKHWSIIWCLVFWLFASFVNIFCYKNLRTEVYRIESLEKLYTTIDKIENKVLWFFPFAGMVIAYTAFIFFGVKLDLKELSSHENVVHDHFFLFVWVLIVFILGLLSLGVIANTILGR